MKLYRVETSWISYGVMFIEAESKKEALHKAKNKDFVDIEERGEDDEYTIDERTLEEEEV